MGDLYDISLKFSRSTPDANIYYTEKCCEGIMSRSCISKKQAILAFLDFADPYLTDQRNYFKKSSWHLTSGKKVKFHTSSSSRDLTCNGLFAVEKFRKLQIISKKFEWFHFYLVEARSIKYPLISYFNVQFSLHVERNNLDTHFKIFVNDLSQSFCKCSFFMIHVF